MKPMIRSWLAGGGVLILAALSWVIAGCSTAPLQGGTGSTMAPAEKTVGAAQNAAQLWAQNCGHCHNIRSPASLSDSQWDVVMLHMRIRGNLTAEEHKQILAFLRSAH